MTWFGSWDLMARSRRIAITNWLTKPTFFSVPITRQPIGAELPAHSPRRSRPAYRRSYLMVRGWRASNPPGVAGRFSTGSLLSRPSE